MDQYPAQTILVVQLRRLGDVLMITPALRALRQAYPDATLDVLTETPSKQLLEHNPHIDSVITVSPRRSLRETLGVIRSLRRKRYELVIDLNGLPSSAWMARATGAKMRLGINHRGRGRLYSLRIPFPEAAYSAQNKLDMLRAIGVHSENHALDFFVCEDDQQWAATTLAQLGVKDSDFLVTLSPVSRQPYKVWPAKNFAVVADHLALKYGAKVLFVFGPGEEPFVQGVMEHMTSSPLPIDYEMPSLAQTKALFERAKLHIGNDNGPAHFAIAAGRPVITIFGEPKAENWSPTRNPKVKALEFDPGCKRACTYPSCQLECLTGTSPETVCQTADELIVQENLVT